MRGIQKTMTVCLVLAAIATANAQTAPRTSFSRNSFWTETIINGSIHNRWRWQMDYQYRRMSDASTVIGGSANPFKNAYQHVYRPWVHFQMNENIRFSLSPIGFWETFTPSGEGTTGKTQLQPEFRVCPQLTLTHKIGRVMIDQRYRYEVRYIGSKVDNIDGGEFGYGQGMDFPEVGKKGRIRYFVRATIPLGSHQKLEDNTFYITTWNELFLGVGEQTYNDKIWDQNRTFCLLGYKPAMSFPMRFELGYGLQYANRFSSKITNGVLTETGNRTEHNNIIQVYVIFENFNKLFASKK